MASKFSLAKLKDSDLAKLIETRWSSSDTLWQIIKKTTEINTKAYENKSPWIDQVPATIAKVQANRIFPNMEAVINSVIANPPGINFIPGREG